MTEKNPPPAIQAMLTDVDGDGGDEAVLDNGAMRLVLAPARGGRLVEWTARDPALGPPRNLLAAHSYNEGEETPAGLADRFLPLTALFRDWAAGRGRTLGDLATGAWEPGLYPTGERWELALTRETSLRAGRRPAPLTVLKRISLGPGTPDLAIHYRIESASERPVQVLFAVGWDFALDAAANRGAGGPGHYELDGAPEPGTAGFAARGTAPDITTVALVEPQAGLTVRLGWDWAATVWVAPAPPGAMGAAITAARVLAVWDVRLPPDDNWAVGLWASVGSAAPPAPLPLGLAERIARIEWDDEA